MIKFNVCPKDSESRELTILTSIDEIKENDVIKSLENVIISPYYGIIGLVTKCSLFELLNSNRKREGDVVSIVPVLAKRAVVKEGEFNVTEKLNILDKVIIAPTELARGYHIVSPKNVYSPMRTAQAIASDRGLLDKCTTGKIWNDINTDEVRYNNSSKFIFIDYKIVPLTSIIGGYNTAK